jgi:chromosome segregation ATPase
VLALEGRLSELEDAKLDKDVDKDLDLLLDELDHERALNKECLELVAQSESQREAALQRLAKTEKQLNDLRRSRKKPSQFQGASDTIAELQERFTSLKDARDKLIEALDDQTADAQRISIENAALAKAVEECRDVASTWERQLENVLLQNSELKNLLEESAHWSADDNEEMEGKLLKSQAKCAQLQVHLHALCAELSRARVHSNCLHRAIHPILSGIEARLATAVCARTQKDKG